MAVDIFHLKDGQNITQAEFYQEELLPELELIKLDADIIPEKIEEKINRANVSSRHQNVLRFTFGLDTPPDDRELIVSTAKGIFQARKDGKRYIATPEEASFFTAIVTIMDEDIFNFPNLKTRLVTALDFPTNNTGV